MFILFVFGRFARLVNFIQVGGCVENYNYLRSVAKAKGQEL